MRAENKERLHFLKILGWYVFRAATIWYGPGTEVAISHVVGDLTSFEFRVSIYLAPGGGGAVSGDHPQPNTGAAKRPLPLE